MGFFDALPKNVASPEAQDMIFRRIVSNPQELRWTPITLSDARGNVLVCEVTFDAIKIENVRINVSAETLQRIADEVGALMLTPLLCDRIWEAPSTLKIPPVTRPITSSTAAMIAQSVAVDKVIAGRSGNPADCGKDWVLVNRLLRTDSDGVNFPLVAANYGWHNTTSGERSVDGRERVIQGVGLRHDRSHTDYSQCARLVRSTAMLNGRPFPMAEVYTSEDFSSMVSHEGPLRLTKQPIQGVVAGRQETVADPKAPLGTGGTSGPKAKSKAPFVLGAGGALVGGLANGPVGAVVGGAAGLLLGSVVSK